MTRERHLKLSEMTGFREAYDRGVDGRVPLPLPMLQRLESAAVPASWCLAGMKVVQARLVVQDRGEQSVSDVGSPKEEASTCQSVRRRGLRDRGQG
jgi:hypothetical protein